MFTAKKLLQAVVIVLSLAALVFVSAALTMKVLTWGDTVVVPDVSGKDVTSAINVLRSAGLEIKVERQEHHPGVPEGSIIAQMPRPGNKVKRGRDVSVVVSLGSEEVTAPNLAGEPFRRAQVVMKQAGLTLGEVARAPGEAPRDSVLVQYPAAQAVLQKGARVDLLISDGPPRAKLVMPDLTGRTLPEAEGQARQLGLRVAASGAGKTVVSQSPAPGYPVLAGAEAGVTLGQKQGAVPANLKTPVKKGP